MTSATGQSGCGAPLSVQNASDGGDARRLVRTPRAALFGVLMRPAASRVGRGVVVIERLDLR